jgi:predicted ATPase
MTSSKNKEALLGLLKSKKLEPYVRHIRFPQYKNLAANTRVDFTYPISALVGANGTNKSSILRALYGAPGHNNLGNFWFSTRHHGRH